MAKVEESADAVRTRRALENAEVIRDFAETTHRAKSWSRERRVIARIEATRLGLDVRFILTNLTLKCPRTVYEMLYCALASDRTSCRRLEANQVRLVLHTAAYWLLLTLRDAIPTIRDLERVRNDPAAPSQNRCAGAGNRKPHPPRLCGKVPGGRPRPGSRRRVGNPIQRPIAVATGPRRALSARNRSLQRVSQVPIRFARTAPRIAQPLETISPGE
jgi:hypothetical protein